MTNELASLVLLTNLSVSVHPSNKEMTLTETIAAQITLPGIKAKPVNFTTNRTYYFLTNNPGYAWIQRKPAVELPPMPSSMTNK